MMVLFLSRVGRWERYLLPVETNMNITDNQELT